MNQFYKKFNLPFSAPEGETYQELDVLSTRLYSDDFYQNLFQFGLEICKNISSYAAANDIEIQFLTLRGSLVTGTVTEDEDIDAVINTKHRFLLERYIEKRMPRFIHHLKGRCPELTRKHPISIYLPRTPANPFERNELFASNPAELEMRTTQAEQVIEPNMRRPVYKFQRDHLKPIINSTIRNKSVNSIKAIELAREIGMTEYNIDRDTTHNSTIISQARCLGFIFSKQKFSQNNIIESRDNLIKERFEEIINEIYYRLGI